MVVCLQYDCYVVRLTLQACIEKSPAYGALSREDILDKWLENTTVQFIIEDEYITRSTANQEDSVLEV